MTRTKALTGLAIAVLLVGAGAQHRGFTQVVMAQKSMGNGVPTFEVDASWPKLPNNWVLGDPSSITVDRSDNVWILHRPRTVPADRKERAAPPVLEFDKNGKFI